MSWRKKVKSDSPNARTGFANWLSQICAMLMTRFFYIIAGRGSAKTTDLQVERLIEMMYDMPGAPVVWVADTYSNLQKNVLRTVLDGLEQKGYREGIHYVIGKPPPEFTEVEKSSIDPEFREHFWRPFNKIATYKHTLVFYTGLNVTFGSLDRPASLAGNSYVHVFGDEVKYFKEEKIANLFKAIRGYRAKYGNSVFYRGRTLTTDMPDTTRIGEYDWILKQGKSMKRQGLMLILKTAFIMNEALQEFIAARESGKTEDVIKKKRTYQRWEERWIASRIHPDGQTFYYIASSYVNVDILTPEYFDDAIAEDLGDFNTAVLSIRPGLESGERFYANLAERHFYFDGTNPVWAERFGLNDEEDCRILKYHNPERALDAGVDFGNMISMSLAQDCGKHYRLTKFIYTLSPDWIRELADQFIKYYAPHKEKTLNLYYDRSGNNYKKAKQDMASQLKKAIEENADGKRTGWKVILMSEGQGNIGVNEEYIFMQDLLSGHNRKLPNVLIDYYHAKPVRCSLELTPAIKNRKGQMVKEKKSEKLAIHRLPLESSNPSDSFKYLMMRRAWRRLIGASRGQFEGDVSIR